MTLVEFLKKKGACDPAMKWAESLPANVEFPVAWYRCPDVAWMQWIVGYVGNLHKSACDLRMEARDSINYNLDDEQWEKCYVDSFRLLFPWSRVQELLDADPDYKELKEQSHAEKAE